VYTSATWNVKEGSESEFVRRWQENADRVALEHPGITFRLLRDTENAQHFISSAGPWRSAEQFEHVRGSDAFQASLRSIEETLESGEISSYELVVEIS
jgi:heme-degrading monooxygenase HmoA